MAATTTRAIKRGDLVDGPCPREVGGMTPSKQLRHRAALAGGVGSALPVKGDGRRVDAQGVKHGRLKGGGRHPTIHDVSAAAIAGPVSPATGHSAPSCR